MDGWRDVTIDDGDGPLGAEELRAFFDGAEPEWRHARAPEIPRRQVVGEAVARLTAPTVQTMVLLAGPAGQGRTTAVRQAAVDLAAQGHRVLFRSPDAGLDASAVAALPPGPVYVLVSDDAEQVSAGLEAGVEALCRAGRRDVHWLLTAREDDWRVAFRGDGRGGFEPSWDRLIDLWPARGARTTALAVTADDARMIVDAWASGPTAEALEEKAADGLLGASLDLRHGPDGLGMHVRSALDGLPAGVTRAFRYAAVAGAVGIDDVDLGAVATLAGVDRMTAAETLGATGLASATAAGVLRVRHPSLARAGFALVDHGDIRGLLGDLVRTGASRAVMTCAPTLSARLQKLDVPPDRADEIARTCADIAATTSGRLLFTLARAVTYRRAGGTAEAAGFLGAALPSAAGAEDWGVLGRQYLLELSQARADMDLEDEAIGLAVLALADVPGLDQPTTTDVKLALAQLGVLCMQLDDLEGRHLRLLQAASHLGPRFTPKWDQRTRSDFRRFGVFADDAGVPACSLTDAFTWLGDELETAVTAPLAAGVVVGGPPGLRQLQAALGAIATH